jgi:Flp pilus assembly protein TadB
MLKQFMSLALAIALVCTVSVTSAFADNWSDPDHKANKNATLSETGSVRKNEARPNDKLVADMLKLVADAKAGKLTPAERSQIRPAKSNNLSKSTKIAIGVGIAVAVVAIVLIVNKPRITGPVL